MPSSTMAGVTRNRIFWSLCLILAIAALTRFVDLGHKCFWIDEGSTAFVVRGDFTDFLHPPGFFALERPVVRLFGESDYTLRLLPAFCGWLTVLFIYLLALQLLADQTYRFAAALVAGMTAAISPYMVAASQENRMYGMVMLIAASSTFFLLKAMRAYREDGKSAIRRAWPWWLAYIVVLSYGTYTHIFTFALLLIGNVYILWQMASKRLRFKYWHYLIVQVIIIAAFLPLVPLTSEHVTESKSRVLLTLSNLGPFYYLKSEGRTLFRYALGFIFASPGERFTETLQTTPVQTLIYLAFIGITLFGLALACWGWIELSRQKVPTHPLAFGLFFIVGLLLIALTMDNALPRQLTLAAPFFFVMIGCGAALRRRKWTTIAAICLWVGNLVLYIPYARADTLPYSSPRWRHIAAFLNENVQPDEAVIVLYGSRDGYYTLKYYQCKSDLFFARRAQMAENMPLRSQDSVGELASVLKSDAALAAELFQSRHYRRIWFVRSRSGPADLARDFTVQEVSGDFGAEIEILVVATPNGRRD